MKKVQRILIIMLAVLMSASILTACTQPPTGEPYEGAYVAIEIATEGENYKATAVVFNDEQSITLTATGAAERVRDALNLLKGKGLHLATSSTQYGEMINEIGTLKPSANEFIAFYSTSTNLEYSFMEISISHNGSTYYSSNYGADSFPILDGVSYIFVLDTF